MPPCQLLSVAAVLSFNTTTAMHDQRCAPRRAHCMHCIAVHAPEYLTCAYACCSAGTCSEVPAACNAQGCHERDSGTK